MAYSKEAKTEPRARGEIVLTAACLQKLRFTQNATEWSPNGCLAASSSAAAHPCLAEAKNRKSFHCSDRENDSKLERGIYSQMC